MTNQTQLTTEPQSSSTLDPRLAVSLTLIEAEYLRITAAVGLAPSPSDQFLVGNHTAPDPNDFRLSPL